MNTQIEFFDIGVSREEQAKSSEYMTREYKKINTLN